MQKFFQKYKKPNNEPQKNSIEPKVKEYLYKYLKELQRHFDISDRKMRIILYRIYKDTSNFNLFIKFIKKKLSVLKSKYKENKGFKHGT